MVTVEGKGGIRATVVAHSISEAGIPICTYELEYPRFIHSEFMTHRMFSRNAASSRAIPIEKMIEQVANNPAMPIHWGLNQPGMKSQKETKDKVGAEEQWRAMAKYSSYQASRFSEYWGLHKQVINRTLEPYQMIKVVCTATEWDNFFYLRDHPDAQPEIAELARCMKEAMEKSYPRELGTGEWHLPYVEIYTNCCSSTGYKIGNESLSLEDAIKISASLCAQVSYRKADESLDKALKIYDMLVTMKPVHASPFEHQATPMKWSKEDCSIDVQGVSELVDDWDKGTTHMDRNGNLWSGNFKGWIQNRQLIPGHVYDSGS